MTEKEFQVPQIHGLELYMPLTADIFRRDEYGDTDWDGEPMSKKEILDLEYPILDAIEQSWLPNEDLRGLMAYYHEEDGVNTKVLSCRFTVSPRNGELWGVAKCVVRGELSADELAALKDFVAGQASDGWGEGFEQREIETEDGNVSVHFWDGDNWSIMTEQERFAVPVMDKQQNGGMNFEQSL